MLNIAGPKFDFANVLYAVLEECEHRRRSFERDQLEYGLKTAAKEKLAEVRALYDEYGGGAGYWKELQKEGLETAMPQYIQAAKEINEQERSGFGVWRGGDVGARFAFALAGLVIGSLIVALPFIPIVSRSMTYCTVPSAFE